MEGDQEDSLPPFWMQSSDSLRRADDRRRRRLSRSSSLFFNSGAFLIVLIVTALAFVFVIIPAILNFMSQIFRPHSVKKSWDTLNLVLVLFAIVCGFLSRNTAENTGSNHGDRTASMGSREGGQKSNPTTPHQWYGYSDRTAQTDSYGSTVYRRLRSTSSYPDLRQESSWVTRDEHWRFYDDTHMANYRPSDSDYQLQHRRRPWNEPEEEDRVVNQLEARNIKVDTFEGRTKEESDTAEPPTLLLRPSSPPPPPRSPPLPPSPPPKEVEVKRKQKRKDESSDQSPERKEFYKVKYPRPPPPSWPPPPPPPPPVPEYEETERKSTGNSQEKKRGNAKEFLTSALRSRKKKRRQKSVELSDSVLNYIDPPYISSNPPPSAPPPPPPPPPPPSVFHTLFSSKKGKTKKFHSFSQSPSPPPPPPPPAVVRISKEAQSRPIPVTQRPTLPAQTGNFDGVEDSAKIGSSSPLIPIPPPPPPPPFKVQDWKFVRHGDFVRIKSDNSSRSGSPDLDGGEDTPSGGASPLAITEAGMSPERMFCPSPDVDTKAGNFIARFRAGLTLEKENSIRERDRGKSRLGPEANSGRQQ